MQNLTADRTAEAPTTVQQALRAADPKKISLLVTHGNADSNYMSVRITKAEAKRLLGLHYFAVEFNTGYRSLRLLPPLAYENETTFEVE